MNIEARLAANVARGAAFLDGQNPGWWERIDLRFLELRDHCRCILGQLLGDYHRWFDRYTEVGIPGTPVAGVLADDLGFNLTLRTGRLDREQAWAVLDNLWIDLIQGRRNPVEVAAPLATPTEKLSVAVAS